MFSVPDVVQDADTFIDILVARALLTPDQIAYTFLQDRDGHDVHLTYKQLYLQASGLAALLQEQNMQGERILLIFKSNHHFIIAFFACVMAGAIAVPTSQPRRAHLAQRLNALAKNSGARAGILDIDDVKQMTIGFGKKDVHWFDMRELSSNGQLAALAMRWKRPRVTPKSLAFLQYTSGTTGDPKGVMISHKNLMANSAIIYEAFGHSEKSVGLIGLPLFHDMGLIGGVFQPLYGGFPVTLMTPAQLIQKPDRWLRLISTQGVTTSGGPNFLYDLAATAIKDEQISGIDLSGWQVAFCGAEPVRAATVEKFISRFQSHGFRREAFYPCYGMAETTLFVTGNLLDQAPNINQEKSLHSGQPTVSCGRPRQDTHVVIVDPHTHLAVAPGQEGEIWISGASNAQGYWHRPQLTAATFQARLASGEAGDWLRSGDLGYLQNGELYISGRMKDVIIMRGRNYAPQDLEVEAELSHAALRPGCAAAFTVVEKARERLIFAFELQRDMLRHAEHWDEIETAVRSAIACAYQLRVDDIVLMTAGALPRTSSGKVKRAQCRADYIAGRLLHIGDQHAAS